MSCKDFEQYLAEYVDGSLPEKQVKFVEAHLAQCEACRSEVELSRFAKTNLAKLSKPELPADLTDRIFEATTQKASWAAKFKAWFGGIPVPAYALVLVAVAAGVVVYRMPVADKSFMEQAPDAPIVAKMQKGEAEKKMSAPAAPPAAAPEVADESVKSVESEAAPVKSKKALTHAEMLNAKAAKETSADYSGKQDDLAGLLSSASSDKMSGGEKSGHGLSVFKDGREENRVKVSGVKGSGGGGEGRGPGRGAGDVKKSAPTTFIPKNEPMFARSRNVPRRPAPGEATTVSTAQASGAVVMDQPPYMADTPSEELAVEQPEDALEEKISKRRGEDRAEIDGVYDAEAAPAAAEGLFSGEGDRARPASLPIVGRYDGIRSGMTRNRTILITSQKSLARIWSEIWKIRINPPPPPYVDFSRQVVVAYSLGTQTTGGYAVRIQEVKREGNILRAHVSIKRPSAGTGLTQALTQPYSLVVVDIGSGSRKGLRLEVY